MTPHVVADDAVILQDVHLRVPHGVCRCERMAHHNGRRVRWARGLVVQLNTVCADSHRIFLPVR